MMKQTSSKKVIFSGVGIFVGLLLLSFVALVGYYIWQIQFGAVEDRYSLEQTLGTAFTLDQTNDSGIESFAKVPDWPTIVREHNPTFGNPDADITIIAFIDFECPYCRRAFTTFEHIREKYAPVTKVVFKHYPIESIHPNAKNAAVAAQCAAEQGKFWEFYQAIFEGVLLTEAKIVSYAQQVRMNNAVLSDCRSRSLAADRVDADIFDGTRIGVRGTPTYIVNGTKYEGVIQSDTWDQIMLHHLQK